MTTEYRISTLQEAQELIEQAIELIREAVKGSSVESACRAYIIPHLSNWAHGENPYDATTIPRLIESFEDEALEEGDEDYDLSEENNYEDEHAWDEE